MRRCEMNLPLSDDRGREPKENERLIASITPGCSIVVSREKVRLIDFYRTSTVLMADLPVKPPQDQKNAIA